MPRYILSQEKILKILFTVSANERKPFLTGDIFRRALRESIREVQAKHPFVIDAWVLLPDHLHCIWTLPPNDNRFPSAGA